MTTKFINSAKYPIRFERLHPGSYFRIVAEPSRGIHRANDNRIYRKAKASEGFYANLETTGEPIILYPEDMVQPIRRVKE